MLTVPRKIWLTMVPIKAIRYEISMSLFPLNINHMERRADGDAFIYCQINTIPTTIENFSDSPVRVKYTASRNVNVM